MTSLPRRARRAFARSFASLAILGALACDDGPTEPRAIALAPGVRIVGGMGMVDTVETPQPPLAVQLRDDAGKPRRGVPVRFAVAGDSRYSVGVCPTLIVPRCAAFGSPHIYGDTGTVVSDSLGMARMPVSFKGRAGDAWVQVLVPSLGVHDSVKYVVRPGRPVRIFVPIGDLAVYVGARFRVTPYVSDRLGNVVSTRVSTTGDAHVSVAANGEMEARAVGRALLTSTGGGFTQRFTLSVVPRGRLALADSAGVFLMELDGSGRRVVASSLRGLRQPTWSADGATIFVEAPFRPAPDSAMGTRLVAIDVASGAYQLLADDGSRPVRGTSPSPSRDGRWLYFAREGGSGAARLELATRRVEPLAAPGVANVVAVDISPTGDRLALETHVAFEPHIRVLDLTTGMLAAADIRGVAPEWSPQGTTIGFMNLGEVPSVAAPDGSGVRALSTDLFAAFFNTVVAFTADGEFVGAHDSQTVLIRVSTGERLTVPWVSHSLRDIAILH